MRREDVDRDAVRVHTRTARRHFDLVVVLILGPANVGVTDGVGPKMGSRPLPRGEHCCALTLRFGRLLEHIEMEVGEGDKQHATPFEVRTRPR